uniref:AlNc14C16G1779 protein n=1 Tax=Albugo laibachii Nc14 TaxID=890382 RepID=F0W4A8_9STRA|nr:AlNc14C16G1779 [Albugo laibachii Nc14]|eukprot:CCA15941.1 AlNc14C16G1779 [Albugo laibachii Nc14]
MVTQHVRNVETLSDNQNSQLSRSLEIFVDQGELDDMGKTRKCDHDIFDQKKSALKRSNRKRNLLSRWTRDRYLTRSRSNAKTDNVEDKNIRGVVNAVCELDPRNYGEAMMSQGKHKWMTAVSEELKALEENRVWEVVILPTAFV